MTKIDSNISRRNSYLFKNNINGLWKCWAMILRLNKIVCRNHWRETLKLLQRVRYFKIRCISIIYHVSYDCMLDLLSSFALIYHRSLVCSKIEIVPYSYIIDILHINSSFINKIIFIYYYITNLFYFIYSSCFHKIQWSYINCDDPLWFPPLRQYDLLLNI